MKRAATLTVLGTLGLLAALDPPFTRADSRLPAPPSVTRTVTVQGRWQGKPVRWWARHAVHNRRALNDAAKRLRANHRQIAALRVSIRTRYAPTVRYAIALARAVYGVDQTRRTYCESTNNPGAVEGHGPVGLLQFKPSTWATTPFRAFPILDPVAQELAGGWMIRAGRSGEWACGL